MSEKGVTDIEAAKKLGSYNCESGKDKLGNNMPEPTKQQKQLCYDKELKEQEKKRKQDATKKTAINGSVMGTIALILLIEGIVYYRRDTHTKVGKNVRLTLYTLFGISALGIVLYELIVNLGTIAIAVPAKTTPATKKA